MNETNAIREQLWDLVYGLLEPDEVAALAALIMGPEGGFITGSDFLIDGGATANFYYGPDATKPA